jgi:NAD(P)-dependent dehydrogenase (short-subunit alcohol dehydrogenase family)
MKNNMNDKRLSMLADKVVVVTGGAGLLGRQLAKSIMEHGGTSVIADLDYDRAKTLAFELAELTGCKSFPIEMDITSPESVDGVISKVNTRYGPISALINNAYPKNKNYGNELFDVTYSDFCENISLNIGGFFLVTQKMTEYFLNQGFGNIISIGSIYGVVAPRFDVYKNTNMTMPVEYAAIKSAILHLNQYFMKYTTGSDIRYNCVSPGGIFDQQPQGFVNKYNEYTHGKGMLHPKDVASVVTFLLSDDSSFINGQNIVVDDGWVV